MFLFVTSLSQPWHWSISGALIAAVMFMMLVFGKRFGISSSLETVCTIGGAGRRFSYFRKNWRDRSWQLVFIGGSILGGYVAAFWLTAPGPVEIAPATLAALSELGVEAPANTSAHSGLLPASLFNWSSLPTLKGLLLMVGGGFLIGYGTRTAGGCTSGHAISGLSELQLPSLVAVIGFFIGGLLATHFLLPLILSLGG